MKMKLDKNFMGGKVGCLWCFTTPAAAAVATPVPGCSPAQAYLCSPTQAPDAPESGTEEDEAPADFDAFADDAIAPSPGSFSGDY